MRNTAATRLHRSGLLGWLIIEQRRDGHPTTFGAASGVVAGLWRSPRPAAGDNARGRRDRHLAGVVCSFAVGWKFRFGYDDPLDVVGVHLIGGSSAPSRSACSPPR